MIFAIHGKVQDLLQSRELPIDLSLLPFLGGNDNNLSQSQVINTKSDSSMKQLAQNTSAPIIRRTPQCRPRDKRKNFWSIHPRDTPPAVAFPKISSLLERTRKSLPAANARMEFLAAMKKSESCGRVVLVTGDTGSGELP